MASRGPRHAPSSAPASEQRNSGLTMEQTPFAFGGGGSDESLTLAHYAERA